MIGIVDYGVGNLRSVEKALTTIGATAKVSASAVELEDCSGLVLPGVGAFGDAMAGLRASGLDHTIENAVERNRPLMGLCVGFQMLFDEGHEFGRHRGLGLLPGRVVRFPNTVGVIPHVGWNQVTPTRVERLFAGIDPGSFFYFVHSFYVEPDDSSDVLATTDYNGVEYASACGRGMVFGVQFHPEKSQATGLRLLENFARLAELG